MEGSKTAEFCTKHKEEGMVFVRPTVDGVGGGGRKRKDFAGPTTEKRPYASKHAKRTSTLATVKVEEDPEMHSVPGAADAIRQVARRF